MKRIFLRFRQGIVCTVNDSFSNCLMLLAMVFLLVGTFFTPTSMLAADKTQSSIHQQTRIMVTTAEFSAAMEHWRRLQLSLVGTYWDAQYNTTETQACAENLLLSDDQNAVLELDQFDPSLGTLTEVEVVIESTTQATIQKMAVWGSEYMMSLNAVLNYTLPGSEQDTMRIRAMYEKEVRSTEMQQNGFNDSFSKMQEKRVILSSQLEAFQGLGKVQIPIQASNLLAFEDAESKLNSDLKVKVCLIYRFTSTN